MKNGLTLYLDAHTQTSLYKRNKNDDKTFTLTLQHYDTFPLAALSGVTVKAGERTRQGNLCLELRTIVVPRSSYRLTTSYNRKMQLFLETTI